MSRSTFGKYVLLRKLASGGMGEVFLAKQRGPSGFEKLLVIKRILSHHLDKRDYLDMFFSEAKLVARLNHNNIIQIQEMGEIDGDYYIAMEYVRGKSLRDIIDELRAEGRMLPLPHVIDLAIKLCEGLGYAHQARDIRGRPMNIVHRDINPHNVLVSYNGDLKLIDFGIAKSEMTSVHTATGTIKGKFVYMSPEQSAADPIDRRSDIFSLGIVLYEMTVLENPFVRQNVVLSLEAIQRHAIPPPSAKRPDAGPMDAILLRALQKRPEDRYQSATEMRDDLRNLFRGSMVAPAEDDISVFLHELFSADIEEEDRLLAEADRATAGVIAISEMPTRASFEVPPSPNPLEAALAGEGAHSSDEEGADPVDRRSNFADEEPTLSGNLEGMAKKSREISGGPLTPPPQPSGQVMTLIPPDEVVPGTGDELLPEIPTRSDRVPGRASSVNHEKSSEEKSRSNPGLAAASAGSNGASSGSLIPAPIPGAPIGPTSGSISVLRSSSSPPPLLDQKHDTIPGRTMLPQAAFDEPLASSVLDPTREMRRGESMAPVALQGNLHATPSPQLQSVAITDEDSGALAQPVPPWRRIGWWIAGLLLFVATAVAGFMATRAATRGHAPVAGVTPMPATADQQPPPVENKDVQPPVPAPDPKLVAPEAQKQPEAQQLQAPPVVEETKEAKEAREAKAREEAKQKKLDEERAAREEKKRKIEEDRQRAVAAREEKKRQLEEEHERAQAAKQAEQKERAEREKQKREAAKAAAEAKEAEREQKKRDAAQRAAEAKEADKQKREAAKAASEAKAAADTKAREDAKAAKAAKAADEAKSREDAKAAKAAKAAEEAKAREDAKAAKAAEAKSREDAKAAKSEDAKSHEDTKAREEKRRVVVPGGDGETAAESKDAPKDAPKDSAREPKDAKAPKEDAKAPKEDAKASNPESSESADLAAKTAKSDKGDKGGGDQTQRFGTLTVSTSVEVNVEVDGKPLGSSPAVIAVRKGSGKIKLFGPNVDYAVLLNYKVEDAGISVKLDANPWAIAKHNGLSLGKTPQSVHAEQRHRFSLLRPGQRAPLVVSLLWNPKNG